MLTVEIEVYVGEVDGPLGEDLAVLSPAERAHLASLRRERDRRRHVAGRSIVRRRLAAATASAPARVPVEIGPTGAPSSPAGPRFSIAHAGRLVLVAFAPCPVGIDVEERVEIAEVDLLFRLFGSPAERAAAAALPRAGRSGAFIAAWVRKEAVVKAAAVGLDVDLRRIDTERAPIDAASRRWRVAAVPVLPQYAAAVAFPAATPAPVSLRLRQAGVATGEVVP